MQSHLLRKCTEREKIKTNGETVQKDGGEATEWPWKRSAYSSDEDGSNGANWIIFRFFLSGLLPEQIIFNLCSESS